MKVSINWIKDFVDLEGVDIEKLISKFTMGVAEVEGVEFRGRDISGVVTAKVLTKKPLEGSHKLHLLEVDAGGGEILKIVCGADNVRVGMITALAKVGARLGDKNISKAKLAGVESFGMCCAEDEIGIGDDHSGIVDFDENTPVGVDIKGLFDIEDIVFEVDNKSLTNRPDLWGHYGIAREIAAIVGRPLKRIEVEDKSSFDNLGKVEVKVSSPGCFRYTSAKMENISEKRSDVNMRIRLFYCGMRSINFLADVTNYIMLELGQPMHAFDGEKVKKIEVMDLENDLNFRTLDGVLRPLKKGNMVIASGGEVVAVAGVMGGEESEIREDTKSVLIESANFEDYKIRTTATALGLRTESSVRYEKSLDPELTLTALLRFAFLVKERDKTAKISSSICDVYNKKFPILEVEISKKYIDDFVGQEMDEKVLLKILKSLEFEILKNSGQEYKFRVPTFRATKDIGGKADLVEEITRVFGYDNIAPKSILQTVKPTLLSREIGWEYDAKLAMASKFNLFETHSYIWYDLQTNDALKIAPKSVVRCVNSINKDNDKIRSSMVPSLLKVVNDNKNLFDSFGTFELGRVVKNVKSDGLVDEKKSLSAVVFERKGSLEKQLFRAKEMVDFLFEYIFNLDFYLERKLPQTLYYHPKNYYEICADGVRLGDIFVVHPMNADLLEEDCVIAGFEVDFSALCRLKPKKTQFAKISKFPTTKLDFNFVVPKEKLYKDIISHSKNLKTELNYSVNLLDIYEGENDKKSFTLHFEVNSFERNLTSADIEKFHTTVIEKFRQNGIELKSLGE